MSPSKIKSLTGLLVSQAKDSHRQSMQWSGLRDFYRGRCQAVMSSARSLIYFSDEKRYAAYGARLERRIKNNRKEGV